MKLTLILLAGIFIGCGDGSFNIETGDNRDNVTNNDFTMEPNEPNGDSPIPSPDPDLECPDFAMGVDGPLGFLWKPVSDSNGRLAIHFPSNFPDFEEAIVFRADTGESESGRRIPERGNGNRQLFRFSLVGGAYTGVVMAKRGDQVCTWQVSNPSIRQD